jgi:hypothetical protein
MRRLLTRFCSAWRPNVKHIRLLAAIPTSWAACRGHIAEVAVAPMHGVVELRRNGGDGILHYALAEAAQVLQRPHDAALPCAHSGKNSNALSDSPMQASEMISQTPFKPRPLRVLRNAHQPGIARIKRAALHAQRRLENLYIVRFGGTRIK